MSKQNRTGGGVAETVWSAEARAMADASIIVRHLALSLPEQSGTRQAFLAKARRLAFGARLRGIEVAS